MGDFKHLAGVAKSELIGADRTMTRFSKTETRRRRKRNARQIRLLDSPKVDSPKATRHDWIRDGRSKFWRKGVKPAGEQTNLLVSGHNNVKIGRDVRIGKLRGYYIYTLSFEERATCPDTCKFWNTCYGNNMPYAKRTDHRDLAKIQDMLNDEIESLLAVRGRVGILVRLHALGDFFSVDYARYWGELLLRYPKLSVYGYTARMPGTPIGNEIASLKRAFGSRFAIRYSDGGFGEDCTVGVSPDVDRVPGAFICPEQMNLENAKGEPLLCANCGLCWTTKKNVAFMEH